VAHRRGVAHRAEGGTSAGVAAAGVGRAQRCEPVCWQGRVPADAYSLVVRAWRRLLIEIVETVVLTILVAVLIQTAVAQPYRVEKISMQDTLQDGQMVLVDKLTPRIDGYHRGDIVVFQPPASDGDVPFIKRIIGVEGDVIELRDGLVRLNGVALDESAYVFHGQRTDPMDGISSWVVPAGSLFVLGDHRGNSSDSRTALGPIPVSSVIGRAILRYWPIASLQVMQPPAYLPVPEAASVP
jgi:signal peptidase I